MLCIESIEIERYENGQSVLQETDDRIVSFEIKGLEDGQFVLAEAANHIATLVGSIPDRKLESSE